MEKEKGTINDNDRLVQAGIGDRIIKRIEKDYVAEFDIEDCKFAVRQVEDIFFKKKVTQVVVEFRNPFYKGMKHQTRRINRAFAVNPTEIANGESLFTAGQYKVVQDLLRHQEETQQK